MCRSAEVSKDGGCYAGREESFQNPGGEDGLHEECCTDQQRERAGHPLRETSRRECGGEPWQTTWLGDQPVIDSVEEILRRYQRAPPQRR